MEKVESQLSGYFLKLETESENSRTSNTDTDSVRSYQEQETDIAKDTSDTDTKSEFSYSSNEEYEIASLSEDEDPLKEDSSSGAEDIYVKAAIAAAICDTSMEAWITDVEDSDTSMEDPEWGQTDYLTCIQCKSQNDNPQFRYCDRCFQKCWQCKRLKNFSGFPLCSKCYKARKTFYPPRPRRFRPRKKPTETATSRAKQQPVALANLRSCLNGLSQDSGVGSSQEITSLNLEDIVVPNSVNTKRKLQDSDDEEFERKKVKMEPEEIEINTTTNDSKNLTDDSRNVSNNKRKLQDSENEEVELKKVKIEEVETNTIIDDTKTECVTDDLKLNERTKEENKDEKHSSIVELKELCITCNSQPKNSIFLHGTTGHMCCCYRCAVRTWHSIKSCPICKMKVQNVVKVFICS